MRLFYKLLYLILLISMVPALNAFLFFDRDNTYECSCEPLYCGAWGIQFQAGIRPIIWQNRGQLTLVNCTLIPSLAVVADVPSFRKLFHLPWQVGGQLSYALSSNTNVFTEVNYAQAKAKNSITFANSNLTFVNLNKYKLIDWYVGARYYGDRGYWCDAVSFFIGGKIGFIHHRGSSASALVQAAANDCCNEADLFGRNTVFAGGGHVGFDYCYCGNWSFVVTAEVVASCGPASPSDVLLTQVASNNLNFATNLFVGHINTEIAFPITLGIKYNF